MYKLLILVSLMTVGCAGSGGSSGGGSSAKSLASVWTKSDNSFTLNMTGLQLGVAQNISFTFAAGAICQCSMTATGLETSGNYALSSCTYTSGGAGDPGCASLNSTGTFSKPSSQLSICDPGCATYN